MYENQLNKQVTSAFDYVGLTNREDLLENILGLSPKATKVLFWITASMQMRPVMEVQDLINLLQVTVDWDAIGIKDRSDRAKAIKELRSIDFLDRCQGAHRYIINLQYVNPFTRKQHEEVVSQLQQERFR